jgi:hypothetical protein
MSERQAEYVAAVIRNDGNIAAAGRELGVSKQASHQAVNSPGAMAVLTQAMAERGVTAGKLAEKVGELLEAQRAIVVMGARGEGASVQYGPDGQTQLGAARLVTDVWERAARHEQRVAEAASRPDLEALERLSDDELLDALARRGRIRARPIEADVVPPSDGPGGE